MKKNIWLKIVLLFLCFFVTTRVNAETCSNKELNSLKDLATNIKLSYELQDDTYNERHEYFFNIVLINLNEKFYIQTYNGIIYQYDNLDSRKLENYSEGQEYNFQIYASDKTNCNGKKLGTKKITVPYYNDYSQKKECLGNEKFELCQPYYGGVIESDDYFYAKLNEYIKNNTVDEPDSDNASIIQKIITIYTSNLFISIPITALVLTIIVVLVIKISKSKKKVRIKI